MVCSVEFFLGGLERTSVACSKLLSIRGERVKEKELERMRFKKKKKRGLIRNRH